MVTFENRKEHVSVGAVPCRPFTKMLWHKKSKEVGIRVPGVSSWFGSDQMISSGGQNWVCNAPIDTHTTSHSVKLMSESW